HGAHRSTTTRRRSPPRCSSRTCAATWRAGRPSPATSGHSTNATRSGPSSSSRRSGSSPPRPSARRNRSRWDTGTRPSSYRRAIVNVGLVTGTFTPSARHAPRTKVVLPAPRSPETRTTSPARSVRASPAATASVSAADAVSVTVLAVGMRPAPEGEAAEQEHEADRGDREHVEAGARKRLGGGGPGLRRGGRRGRGLRLRRRLAPGLALRGGRLGPGLLLRGLRLRCGGLRRLGLRRGAERVLVLRVA